MILPLHIYFNILIINITFNIINGDRSWNMSYPNIYVFISRWYCQLKIGRELKLQLELFANHLTLQQEIILNYTGGSKVMNRDPKNRKKADDSTVRRNMTDKGVNVKTHEKVHEPLNLGRWANTSLGLVIVEKGK